MALELLAPAKINLTLEVLGRRDDGYHEVATLMQTIDMCDRLRIEPANTVALQLGGEALAGVPLEGPGNLAYRAALALMEEAGDMALGARIILEKRVPAGSGLGGGSSDAAAVLRGLNRFWGLDLEQEALSAVAARVGSDVSFFLHCGTAECRGRGEAVNPLPDHVGRPVSLFISSLDIQDKTRRMYAFLVPADYTDGRGTQVAAATIRRGLPLNETDVGNVFDRYVVDAAPAAGKAMAFCREAGFGVHATGSGPGFFALIDRGEVPGLLARRLADFGVSLQRSRLLTREEALAMREA